MPPENPILFGSHTALGNVSLRDLFAAAAISGMAGKSLLGDMPAKYASDAYELADAMLLERSYNTEVKP